MSEVTSETVTVQVLNLAILPPRSADAMRLTALLHQLSQSYAEEGKTGLQYYLEHSKNGSVLVVREKSVIVASGCYMKKNEKGQGNPVSFSRTGKPVAFIHGIVTDASCRGKGYGGTLVQALISAAQSEDITLLQLTSNQSREGARRLYTRLGFSEVGEVISSQIDENTQKPHVTTLFELDLSR
jgi:ribosomal protein S18 acetylase RimI-like enzyme